LENMKNIVRLILYILYLSVPGLAQISYDISHSNTLVSYSNAAGGQFTTNTSFSNITVHETRLARFLITTNGGELYAGSNFIINIRAVDRRGYHITLTNTTNLHLTALDTNTNLTGTNFSITNLPFVSPSAFVPDFNGIATNISYPVPGLVYLEPEGNTNTNTPGLLDIKSIVQQILVANPCFIPQHEYTNIKIYGIDINGSTNDITSNYVFTSADPENLTVDTTNRIYTVTVGPGVLEASNTYSAALSTNITVLVTVLPGDTAVISNSNCTAAIGTNSYNEEVYVDLRTPPDPASLIYPLDSYIPDQRADVAEANSSVDTAQQAEYVFTNRNIQITPVLTNGTQLTPPFSGAVTITFSYDGSDLVTGAGNEISEQQLRIVKLTNEGGTYRWIELSNSIVDPQSNTVRAAVKGSGVYSLASRINTIPDNLSHVEVFPNPADLRQGHEITIFNLPRNTQKVKIFRVDGRQVALLRDVREQVINGAVVNGVRWDGKNREGKQVPAGLYFVNVVTAENNCIVKLLIQNDY